MQPMRSRNTGRKITATTKTARNSSSFIFRIFLRIFVLLQILRLPPIVRIVECFRESGQAVLQDPYRSFGSLLEDPALFYPYHDA